MELLEGHFVGWFVAAVVGAVLLHSIVGQVNHRFVETVHSEQFCASADVALLVPVGPEHPTYLRHQTVSSNVEFPSLV